MNVNKVRFPTTFKVFHPRQDQKKILYSPAIALKLRIIFIFPPERSIYNGGGEESIAMRSVGPWGVDGVSGRHSSSTPEHSCHSGPPPPPVETQPDHNLLPSGVVVNKIVMSSDNRLVSNFQIVSC